MTKEQEDKLARDFYGNGALGVMQKVTIMWRIHVWVLCTLSGGIGLVVGALVRKFIP